MTLTAVTQHLRILEASGLVHSYKQGRTRHCRLRFGAMDQVTKWIDARKALLELSVRASQGLPLFLRAGVPQALVRFHRRLEPTFPQPRLPRGRPGAGARRAAGERFSVSLSTVEFLPDGTGTLMRVTEHGAYFDGNPEGPQMRVHGIGEQLDLLGRVLQKDQD
jgi:hypothetical protein